MEGIDFGAGIRKPPRMVVNHTGSFSIFHFLSLFISNFISVLCFFLFTRNGLLMFSPNFLCLFSGGVFRFLFNVYELSTTLCFGSELSVSTCVFMTRFSSPDVKRVFFFRYRDVLCGFCGDSL